ncbi:sulfotransferase family 2 domain-containing protein [Pleurocapsales cyanobacterium LEGE 10410]|nr:sulfotransferase family 2 domain-containing protein [Pleurocapsales cyanobacterium LEGE 10410]
MISHKHKFIFIHIPKCGGTSIESFLKKNTEALGYQKEDGLEYTMRKEGLAKIINLYPHYFTFTFVRNPFDRFVSIWKHSERGQTNYYHKLHRNLSFKEYAYAVKELNLAQLSQFDLYHSKQQTEFILDYNKNYFFKIPRKTNDKCDFIGKLENLQRDFKQVCELLNLKLKSYDLALVNTSPEVKKIIRPHYSSYYDNETLEVVSSIYAEDIKYLSYKFERKEYTIDLESYSRFLFKKIRQRLSTIT